MGDRRVADRRAPEEGVVKIKTNQLIIYCILGIVIAISLIGNIILGILYHNYKKAYDSLTNYDSNINYDYHDDEYLDEEIEETSEEEYSCILNVSSDKDKIKPGETITYEIKATDINAGDGITMFETVLDYDSDNLECDVFVDEDGQWNKTALTENYLTMARKDLMPNSEDQVIAKISVKAKDNIQDEHKTLTLSKIRFTMDNDESFDLPDENIDITVSNN